MVTLYERLVDLALSHQRTLLCSTVDSNEGMGLDLSHSDESTDFAPGGLLGDLPFLMNELGRAYVNTGNIDNAERAYKNSLDLMATKLQSILASASSDPTPSGNVVDVRAHEIRNLNKFRGACLHRLGEVYITSCRYARTQDQASPRSH
jgi:hypothetical protein